MITRDYGFTFGAEPFSEPGNLIPPGYDPTVLAPLILTDIANHPEWVDHRPKWRRNLSKLRRLRLRLYVKD